MGMKCICILALFFVISISFGVIAHAEGPYVYDSHGRRDPFVPLLGVTSGSIGSLEDIMGIEDVSFQGFAVDSAGRKVVVLNGEMITEGRTIGRLTVKKILRNEVILIIDGSEHTLNIYQDKNR